MEDDDFVCWVVLCCVVECCSGGDGGSTWRASSTSFLFLRSATYRKRREGFNVRLALRHPSRASEVDPLGGTTNFFIEGRFSRPVKEEALEELCCSCCCDVDGKSSIENFQPKTRILLGPIGRNSPLLLASVSRLLQTPAMKLQTQNKFITKFFCKQTNPSSPRQHQKIQKLVFFFFFFFFFF